MKLKHLTIFFLLFAILSYVVFMVVKNNAIIEAEKAKIAEIEKAEKAKKTIVKQTDAEKKLKLPRNWQTMAGRRWINFLWDGITAEQMQFMIDNGLDPNKMLTVKWSDGEVTQYSLLYRMIHRDHSTDIIKILLDAGADANLTNEQGKRLPLDQAIQWEKFDVALLLIKHGGVNTGNNYKVLFDAISQGGLNDLKKFDFALALIDNGVVDAHDNYQTLYDEIFQEMVHSEYGLDRKIDIPKAMLILEDLIAKGVNTNNSISYEIGDYGYSYTPISYTIRSCMNNYNDDGKIFYLDIIKLLIDSGMDWNAKDYEGSYYYDDTTPSITDTLKWMEERASKPECLDALAYVQNHIKENNITLEE